MTRALIIYAHPNPDSFNASLKNEVEEALKEKGIHYLLRDLNSMGFNPVLSMEDLSQISQGKTPPDIVKEQEFIREADTLILVFPMWWYSFPAILKGYIDRVFSYGFAYKEENGTPVGLLRGKRAIILCTLGGSEQDYGEFAQCLKSTFKGTFEFCGIEVHLVKFFYAVPYVSHEDRKRYLKEAKELLLSVI